jgi:archaellum biogenesis ATPase FlaH
LKEGRKERTNEQMNKGRKEGRKIIRSICRTQKLIVMAAKADSLSERSRTEKNQQSQIHLKLSNYGSKQWKKE